MATTSAHAVSPGPSARGDLQAYSDSVRLSSAALVAKLRDLLGPRLVAYLGNVKETRATRQWADGTRQPPQEIVDRLRLAYRAAAVINDRDSASVVQAWFQGASPLLDEISPARFLRDTPLEDASTPLMRAANAFAAHG